MERHVHIDFETRSQVNLLTQGTWNYAVDPSTSIICCAYAVNNEEPRLVIGEGYPNHDYYMTDWSELITLAQDPEVIFFAHNATFEMRLWEHQLTKKYGLPIVPIERWVCTMALAYMFNLPGSLDDVGKALGLDTRKDKKGKMLIQQLSVPRKVTKTRKEDYIEVFWDKYKDEDYSPVNNDKSNGLYWDNTPEKFYEFYDYCATDVKVERGVSEKLPRLLPFERKIWEMDKYMNREGMQVDLELIDAAVFIFEEHKKRLTPIFKEITGFSPTQPAKVIQWLIAHGIEEKRFVVYKKNAKTGVTERKLSMDKDKIVMLLADKEITGDNRKVIEIRKNFSKSSIAKYTAFKKLADVDGVLRDYLVYGRAVTMRWGGNGAQPQNLPSRGCAKNQDLLIHLIKMRDYDMLSLCYPDISQALSSAIRGVIIAREGHEFIVSDYASIEARLVMWFAGETKACEDFVNGADLYVDMAKDIYEDPTITKDKNPSERNVGKQTVLGCGFGMAHKKFMATCESFGITVDVELAKKAVKAYRTKYKKVVSMWYDVNNCAMHAARHPGTKVYVKATGNKIYYICKGSYLYCILPSGRPVIYPFPKVETLQKDFGNGNGPVSMESLTYMKQDSAQGNKWVRVDTFGGKLTENFVQALARDIMSIGGLNCNDYGYQLRLMVHDEAITEVKTGFGTIEECERLLAQLPEWADGCPITAADGWRGDRYRK